ncbi:DNA repair protein RadC [Elusimicrobiota bacterium]
MNTENKGHRARLRKRFLDSGLKGMADYELIELLLTFSILRRDVKPVAKKLLRRFKSIKGTMDASPDTLRQIQGMGPSSIAFFSGIKALMHRYFEQTAKNTDLLNSPEAVVSYCRTSLESEKNEIFEVLYLSSKNHLIASERLSEGTIDRAAVYPRRVIEGALSANAAALIFVHNHPSGDPTPSKEDIELTKTLAKAVNVVGITAHDHIIIGNGHYVSLREGGLFPKT